jgi:UDP-N-acetylmuramoyl-L-alanyl-D-glutamate--2,6-diaminopimelate ligase
MTLKELFAPLGQEAPPLPVRGLTQDSRRVEPGFVFVAVPGVPLPHRRPLDGHAFIPEALRRGAIAVVGEQDLTLPVPTPGWPIAARPWPSWPGAFTGSRTSP